MTRRTLRDGWLGNHTAETTAAHPLRSPWPRKEHSAWLDRLEPGALGGYLDRFAKLESLGLAGKIADEDLAGLASLTGLRHVTVKSWQLTAAGYAHLAKLPLESLAIELVTRSEELVGLEGCEVRRLFVGSLRHSGDDESGLKTVFGLPLEELHLHSDRAEAPISREAVEPLAERETVRDLYITTLGLSHEAAQRTLETRSLEAVTLDSVGAEGDLTVRELPALHTLELSQLDLASVTVEDLPQLRSLVVHKPVEIRLARLPELTAFDVPSFTRAPVALSLEALPKLVVVQGTAAKVATVEVSELPVLREVNLPAAGATLDESGRSALEATGARLRLQKATYAKRKRTAPKRKLKAKEWTHPHFAVDEMAWAVVIAGRRLESDTKVSVIAELARIAECQSIERGEHLAVVTPHDLTKSSGVYPASARIAPAFAGVVVAAIDADESPVALDPAFLTRALERAEALPEELWAELAGAQGTDELEQSKTALYLVACGPLAGASLARGEIEEASSDLLVGQRFDQSPQPRGVRGAVVAAVHIESLGWVELDGALEGPLALGASYD